MFQFEYNIIANQISTILICYALIALWWYCDGRFIYKRLEDLDPNDMGEE